MAQGIQRIILHATRRLALAKTLGRLGIHGIDAQSHLQQSLHLRPAAGLDGDAGLSQHRQLLFELAPALGAVGKLHLQHDQARAIDDGNVMLLAGPVKAGKMLKLMEGSGGG